MARRQLSFPLYIHITLLAVVLVVLTGESLRWFGDAIPGAWEFFLLVALAASIALLVSRRIVAPLARLAQEAEAVRRFDFSDHPVVRSSVREIDAFGAAFDLMRDAVRRFLRINQQLVTETDFDRLRPWLLDKLVDIAEARGGALYLADASGALRITALDVEGGKAKPAPDLPPLSPQHLPLLMEAACKASRPLSGHLSVEELCTLGLDEQLAKPTMLALPLRDRHDQLLGMLLLFKDEEINEASIRFIEALAASAATSLETQELVKEQKALLEATIRMIAGAIDDKSPYTGGHCARVPELTFMLARAACAQDSGPYADFAMSEERWEQLHLAAWLHDCGKVITPEYIVDKATKLETVHNRIHEVRTRFEVLKRDAWIAYWKGVAEGGEEALLAQQRDALLQTLDEEFAFVARCNVGGEFLPTEQKDRLRGIGARRWLRTLDDRLGLSRDELERMPRPAPMLPVEEPLLADRPEHRVPRNEAERIPEDNRWGFRMAVPELLYDRGELHNLTISRGTLTEEDRYKINQHIVQTIKMLGELPLPRHLREVPQIAGGHHEKMDGTGYPCRLDRSQLSVEARMMAIADIFEALTAADRPYKSGKTLSESIAIMAKMCKDQHIDPELFELFLRAGVHNEYANRYLKPEQIDAVRIEDYLP
ncbi:MAG: HAMP domain-containing protein [Thermomonas sp.]|uniref:HD-GYP domain-containing protein n=1 Tax=Thermomonas sp. TaxID=1971895 RepID=UPI002614B8AC|nr:HD domain-containing phosphohydrolase [Thermomonas sp.]MCC7096123.1 HAMP domain-containing protein [Thermomonas sp.]